jgi:hypothetical protein
MDSTAEDNRLRKFAGFFKSYMGVMPLITAAVAPLLTLLRAIPVFETDRTTLATYSGLLGFLMVAWVFYARSMFVPTMVPLKAAQVREGPDAEAYAAYERRILARRSGFANLLPLFLIALSVASYICYLRLLDYIIDSRITETTLAYRNVYDVLRNEGISYTIPYHGYLQVLYLGIFLFSEAAFVVMALREYAYGVLQISEASVLGDKGRSEAMSKASYSTAKLGSEIKATSE